MLALDRNADVDPASTPTYACSVRTHPIQQSQRFRSRYTRICTCIIDTSQKVPDNIASLSASGTSRHRARV